MRRIRKGFRYLFLVLIITILTVMSVKVVLSGPPNRVKVLIGFNTRPGLAEEAQIRQVGGLVRYRYHLVNAIAAIIPENAIYRLQNNPRINRIEPDLPMHAVDIELVNSWGVTRIGAGTVHENNNRGEGVNIAIIDSGIDRYHPDLDDNYKGGYNFINPANEPLDVYGHGTHVAGTACAEDNNNGVLEGPYGVVGVAPGCNLYALKVLEDNGWGDSGDLIAALEWALDNGIHVANLSLGWDRYPGVAVEQAFINAEQLGLVIVASACNNGKWHGNGENVCYPGKFASVIAVAATDSDPNNTRASFSSTGSEVELAAPGVSILSTWNDTDGYSDPDPVCHIEEGFADVCYKYGSGTSMASPHVAGTAALIIASGITDSNGNERNNDEVRQRLIDTSDDLGTAGWDTWYGHGLVNAVEAVNLIQPVADVAITTLNGPESVDRGDTVTIFTTVANIGTENVTDVFAVTLNDTTSGTEIGTMYISGLDAGVSTQLIYIWDTELTETGPHILVAFHDFNDENDGNNSLNLVVNVSDAIPEELTVEAVEPIEIYANFLDIVTVSGTGFAQGALVTFEDGKGVAPSATTRSVSIDGTEIVIDVAAKHTPKPVTWTIRVTNPDGATDVLEHALTVLP